MTTTKNAKKIKEDVCSIGFYFLYVEIMDYGNLSTYLWAQLKNLRNAIL